MKTTLAFALSLLSITACGTAHIDTVPSAPVTTPVTYSLTGTYAMQLTAVSGNATVCGHAGDTTQDGNWRIENGSTTDSYIINTKAADTYPVYVDATLADGTDLVWSTSSTDNTYSPACNVFKTTTVSHSMSLNMSGQLVGTVTEKHTGGCAPDVTCIWSQVGMRLGN